MAQTRLRTSVAFDDVTGTAQRGPQLPPLRRGDRAPARWEVLSCPNAGIPQKHPGVLPYDPHLKPLATKLRKNSTIGEILLWTHLKGAQRHGFDFHRQKPILHWIVDFFCAELMFAIEVDGDSHRFRPNRDAEKEAALNQLGVAVLRCGDSQVRNDINGVVAEIDRWIVENRGSRGPRATD